MAAKYCLHIFIAIMFLKYTTCKSVYMKMPEIEIGHFNSTTHLRDAKIKMFCENRDQYCKYNGSGVCSFRNLNNTNSYLDFKNVCYMFMSNMCDYPGKEYHIISSDSCEKYLLSRRNDDAEILVETENNATNIEVDYGSSENITTEHSILRNKQTISTLYPVSEAYDGHSCPYSCPNTYSPQCINVNRGMGKYFKMFTFVNHCMADLYYCKHYHEFEIVPDEDHAYVSSSPLGWSYCGASRYLQFARFAEVTSSMGKYGWLAGSEYRYSHIMEPHERMPGYG